ncbi:hypothetical protein ACR42D_04775 [Desulfovibrio caledoniensis]
MEHKRHPTSKIEIQLRRLEHVVASQAIEGNPLTEEEIEIFKNCILKDCSFEERTAISRESFPGYEQAS